MNVSCNPFSLEGKTILITGASSGIGRATAIECSKMGATLILNGRNEERLAQTAESCSGKGHIFINADLTQKEELKRLIEECPKLDGVILCSGIFNITPCVFSTPEKFDLVYQTNLFAPIELTRLLIKKKKINKYGSIVYTSSIASLTEVAGNSIYGSAKAALSHWTKYLALEMKPKAIRVNSVSPGMIATDNAIDPNGSISPEQHQLEAQKYIYSRYGEPEEVAYLMVYLMSDASKWVTGTNVVIDGGAML